jgi:hypothetical protein
MIIRKLINRLSFLTLLGSLVLMTAYAAEKPSIRGGKDPVIEVKRISPSKGDVRKAKQKRKQRGQPDEQDYQVYAVKLYVNMPPPSAEGYDLYVGETKVQEFGNFAEGVFFKVYEPSDLELLRGKPVRFVLGEEVVDLGLIFPARRKDEEAVKLPELHEVLRPKP